MKKKFKILIPSIIATGLITTSLTLGITSCATKAKSNLEEYFYQAYNDPYKELEMFAKSLDKTNVQFFDGEKINFTNQAIKINQSLKQMVVNLANLPSIKKARDNHATVLFVKNEYLDWNDDPEKLSANINEICIDQPIIYSSIYAQPENKELPGFGMYFPTPRNHDANSLFDDWFEIGAKARDNSSVVHFKHQVGERLALAFRETADLVFYVYDSNRFKNPDYETKLREAIMNQTDSFASAMLKNDALVKKVIPIDAQWFYYGVWDPIGVYTINLLFSLIMSNIENQQIKNFAPLFKDEFNWQLINSDPENIQGITNKMDFQPFNQTLKHIRPQITNDQKALKFYSTIFNITGHTYALGIAPDYILGAVEQQGSNTGKYKQNYGYLQAFYQHNKTLSSFKDLNYLENANDLYLVGANRDKLNDNIAPWPINIMLRHGISNIGDLINSRGFRVAYSERNDTKYSQQIISFPVYDTLNNNIIPVNEWINKW